jgi:plastocyanin
MHFICLLIWIVFASGGVGQETHTIRVDGSTLKFDPDTLYAAVGSSIIWEFHPKNHSVVQADVKTPCAPLAMTPKYSGFVPVSDSNHPISMKMTLQSSLPLWYYCGKDDHCANGMVGVINPLVPSILVHFDADDRLQSSELAVLDRGGVAKKQHWSQNFPATR